MTKFQFGNAIGAEVSQEATARYYFTSLSGSPWIEVRPAYKKLNSDYTSAMLRALKSQARKVMQGGQLSEAEVERYRDFNRAEFPVSVCTGRAGGWTLADHTPVPMEKHPLDEGDERTQCPEGMLEELFAKGVLPDDILDPFFNFPFSPDVFRELEGDLVVGQEPLTEEDVEDTAGNSSSASSTS